MTSRGGSARFFAEVDTAELGRWSQLLEQVAEIIGRRLEGTYSPKWGAATLDELKATSAIIRPDGFCWGEEPYSSIWGHNAVLVKAVLDHANSLSSLLLHRPGTILPLDVLTRALLEAASQSIWLMDRRLHGRARVARLYVIRRASAQNEETTAKKMGAPSNLSVDDTPTQLDNYYLTDLGLTASYGKKGGWTGCEGQLKMSYSERIADFMRLAGKDPSAGPYAYLCGGAHSELWRLLEGYRQTDYPKQYVVHSSRLFTRYAVMVAVEATLYAGAYSFYLLGQTASLGELRSLVPNLRAELQGWRVR